MVIRGSCNCKAVQFTLETPPKMMGTCHCSPCRKSGANIFVFVQNRDLSWVSGKEAIGRYGPYENNKYTRCFCKICGTGLGEILSDSESLPINAHCLDDDLQIQNSFHEFVDDKPSWINICDDAKQFPKHPP